MGWRLTLALAVFSLAACGQWRGDGNDEFLPDVAGSTLHVDQAFGDRSAILQDEHADDDIRLNRPGEEEEPSPEPRECPFVLGH